MMIVNAVRWRRVDDERVRALAEGKMLRVTVNGKTLRFVRLGGTLRAFTDRCPHQGRSFEGGWCEDGHVVCPWHRFHFDPVTGRNKFDATGPLEIFPVEEQPSGIRVGFAYRGLRLFGRRVW